MKNIVLAGFVILSINAYCGGKVHWGYSGKNGPSHWGELDKSFEMCSKGKNQSPINLKNFLDVDLKPIKFNYGSSARDIVNNGHTIQVDFRKGSEIRIDNIDFQLLQFHFHTPSENHIKGKEFPMEAHLVHVDNKGNIAVIAVMFELGKANPLLATLWKKMPEKTGEMHQFFNACKANGLLPEDKDYYRFNGSLTTPPGTEGVRWFVMKKSLSVSKEQVKKFAHVMHHPNNRPLQPINARVILK